MSKFILLVDDDALLRRSLTFNLEQGSFRVQSAASAEDALAMARCDPPDLVLLDISLPGMDGLDAMRHLKETLNLPVVFLTARRREIEEVLGLELGADDYITKPFDVDVLLAHIKAVLRRTQRVTSSSPTNRQDKLMVGDLTIDTLGHSVTLGGRDIPLSPREFDLLHTLALDPGRVISVDELLGQVWGAEFIGQPQVLYVHIRWLREKLEKDPNQPHRIRTVRGVGYILQAGRN